ncbi:MAG: thermonuclease family protein [Rhodobiaceae bacterium]|nr:thermonuclease family protein [Rhodobiaceae bacterium]
MTAPVGRIERLGQAARGVAARIWPWRSVPRPDQLKRGGTGEVIRVIDGDTVELSDSTMVRLVGIQAPKLPLGRPGFKAWPHGEEALAALEQVCLDKRVGMRFGGRRVDFNGRRLAHLFVESDGEPLWLQQWMIAEGHARVYSFDDNRSCVRRLLADEAEARNGNRGLWALENYKLLNARTPREIAGKRGEYHIVEGTVTGTKTARRRVFIDFGTDWRHDFTAVLASSALRRFDWERFAPKSLVGERVRIRGWIGLKKGPYIDVTHPEQIERVTD